jgi:prepilin-type N-terminal cleavage/methylation domain-containing protein
MMSLIRNNHGFTLVEVLVALVIDFVVLAGIYAAFYSQQKSHVKEQQVVDAQQNVRGAAAFMIREIRLAGLDGTGTAGAGIIAAGPHSFEFSLDRNNQNGINDDYEIIKYGFSNAVDADLDGKADPGAGGAGPITRFSTNDGEIADDIRAIAFAYAYDENRDGELEYEDTAPMNGRLDPGEEIWAYDDPGSASVGLDTNNADHTALAQVVSLDRIRAVRIWILARTSIPLRGKAVTKNYVVGDKPVNETDNFQYRLLTATVKVRNLGL